MSHQLTPAAEACRLNIKELIPAAEVTDKDNDGNVKYGGKELSFAVSKLGKELGIGEVRKIDDRFSCRLIRSRTMAGHSGDSRCPGT